MLQQSRQSPDLTGKLQNVGRAVQKQMSPNPMLKELEEWDKIAPQSCKTLMKSLIIQLLRVIAAKASL